MTYETSSMESASEQLKPLVTRSICPSSIKYKHEWIDDKQKETLHRPRRDINDVPPLVGDQLDVSGRKLW